MRILHVNKYLHRRGGAETYMLEVAGRQRAAGHEVAFMAMQHPENQPSEYAGAFPPLMELAPPPRAFGARLRTAAEIVYRPSARRGMEEVLGAFAPDVVHLHNIYHQLSPSILRPLAAGDVPAVMTLHDYKLACPTYRLLHEGQVCEACLPGRFHHAALRRCNGGSVTGSVLVAVESAIHHRTGAYDPVDRLICPSRFMLETMSRAGQVPDRLVHVPHFCDLDAHEPATRPGRGIAFVGRLSPEKGVDVLLEAMASTPPDVRLRIAGDGPALPALRHHAAQRGLEARVDFLGHLDPRGIGELMRSTTALVVPSRWHENQPMVILEARACARPVIGSDLGGISELVRPGVDGLLVPHDDPAALAEAIVEVTRDPGRSHEWGRQGRLAASSLTPERHLQRLDVVYAEASARKMAAA